jgi:hypothetical protein
MAAPSGSALTPGGFPGSRATTPDPYIPPRDRLAALMAQWRNTPAPATISQDDLQRNVGTLRIAIDYSDQLHTQIQTLRASASAVPYIDVASLTN